MKTLLTKLKNEIDFFLRNLIPISRKNYYEANEVKEGLFGADLRAREENLLEMYIFEHYKSHSTRENYCQNLYILDILDKYLDLSNGNKLEVLDVGCKNWLYASAQNAFFQSKCNLLSLDGIELDYNRLYSNFYSRGEVAKYYIRNLPNCNYIKGDFLKNRKKYDVITWFLPFVFEDPHALWGLPKRYFKPLKMLGHAYDSLNKGGKLFIVNQGELEYEAQKIMCADLSLQYEDIGEISSGFWDTRHKRYAIIIEKLY